MLSKSKIQTQKLAAKLAGCMLKAKSSEALPAGRQVKACVVALSGDLGSGKTTFVQGFMKALGVKHRITSPTFVIFRKYEIATCNMRHTTCYKNVFHFDLYRINKLKEVLNLGFRKIINNPENIVLIEWPELVKKQLPKNTIWVEFEHGKNKNGRVLKIKTTHFG